LRRQVCLAAKERADLWARGDVRRSNGSTLTASEQNCAEQLARFFPQATPVRIPVQVTALRGGRTRLREATVVEFGGREHAIFLSTLPLEFDDRVRLEAAQEGRPAEATVVAVQYHEGRKAVAVSFLQGPCDWVTQP
jgi:hypothetical protein